MTAKHVLPSALLVGFSLGCVSAVRTDVVNAPGRATVYEDPQSPTSGAGLGIESQDIIAMADTMVRDILASLPARENSSPLRIVIDGRYFENAGSGRIDKDLITERIRVQLARASGGRLLFLARHQVNMVEDERTLEQAGRVTGGSGERPRPALGYDCRMGGRIASRDQYDPRSGMTTSFYQITFELVERGSGAVVWTNLYEFRKSGADDVVYR